jgi:hypothetical protein
VEELKLWAGTKNTWAWFLIKFHGYNSIFRSKKPLLISEAISHLLSVCFFPGRASSWVLGPFAPSHRPHLHSFFLGAGELRLAALAVRSSVDAALGKPRWAFPCPCDLPISSITFHSFETEPLPEIRPYAAIRAAAASSDEHEAIRERPSASSRVACWMRALFCCGRC